MEQLEQLTQWISANQQTTLIAGIACVFGAIIFLFWASREFASWFLRTGHILDEIETLRGDVKDLSQLLRQQNLDHAAQISAIVPAAEAVSADLSLNRPVAAPELIESKIAKLESLPVAQFENIKLQNGRGPSLRSNLTTATPQPSTFSSKNLFPIRPS